MLRYQISGKSVQWELRSYVRADKQPERQTDGHDAANSPFHYFANALKNKVSISPKGSASLKVLILAFQINFLRTWNYQILKVLCFCCHVAPLCLFTGCRTRSGIPGI